MRELQLLIKPASSNCNLRCRYCFYEDEANSRQVPSYGIMTQEIVHTLVEKAMAAADSCVFGFQGGEPVMAGLDYYVKFVEEVEKYKKPGQKAAYTIQTNGVLLDEPWMKFFKTHGFLVGVSLDGTKELHDWNRVDKKGKGTFSKVLKNARSMQEMGIPVNILCVLTHQSARKIRSVYEFLKKQGFYHQQYIPCLDPIGEERGSRVYSLKPGDYAQALKELFDLWFQDQVQGTPVSVRQLDNWLHVLMGGLPEACAMYGKCTMQNVIEADGGLYPCDFYVLDEYCMGNIKEENFVRIWEKSLEKTGFFKDGDRRDDRCSDCVWYPLCRGGCRRDCIFSKEGSANYYCEAYQEFFAYAIERMEWLADRYKTCQSLEGRSR